MDDNQATENEVGKIDAATTSGGTNENVLEKIGVASTSSGLSGGANENVLEKIGVASTSSGLNDQQPTENIDTASLPSALPVS